MQPPHDLVERRRALAIRRRLLVGQLGELGLELQVDAARPVLDREQRLRRQRLELRRQLLRVVAERVARPRDARAARASCSASFRSAGSPDFACFSTRSSRRSTWSRSATSSSSSSVSRSRAGSASGREAVRDGEDRVDLAEPTEERGPGSRDVDDADRRRRHLPRPDQRRHPLEPVVRDRRHADVLLAEAGAAGLRQRREERGLPRSGKPDDPDLERHLAARRRRAPRSASGARRARGAGATSRRPRSCRGSSPPRRSRS